MFGRRKFRKEEASMVRETDGEEKRGEKKREGQDGHVGTKIIKTRGRQTGTQGGDGWSVSKGGDQLCNVNQH